MTSTLAQMAAPIDHYMVDYEEEHGRTPFFNERPISDPAVAITTALKVSLMRLSNGTAAAIAYIVKPGDEYKAPYLRSYVAVGDVKFSNGVEYDRSGRGF